MTLSSGVNQSRPPVQLQLAASGFSLGFVLFVQYCEVNTAVTALRRILGRLCFPSSRRTGKLVTLWIYHKSQTVYFFGLLLALVALLLCSQIKFWFSLIYSWVWTAEKIETKWRIAWKRQLHKTTSAGDESMLEFIYSHGALAAGPMRHSRPSSCTGECVTFACELGHERPQHWASQPLALGAEFKCPCSFQLSTETTFRQ